MTVPFDNVIDPDERLDYPWDWSARFAAGETISGTAAWTVPTGITQDGTSQTATTATIWLKNATLGQSFPITCHVTTNQSRTMDWTQTLRCRQK